LVAAKRGDAGSAVAHSTYRPIKYDPAIAADPQRRNNFSNAGDEQGLRCPIGALRRSNPRHAFETRERGEAATADSARHRVRPASPEQRVQDDGVDRGLINLFMQAISSGEFIRLDPNDQDPLNVTGGECSQMSVPRQTAFPVRSSNVRESEG